MDRHISIAAIRGEITQAILKHTEEIMASDMDYDEKRRLTFPIGALSIINAVISKVCEDGQASAQ